MREKEKADQLYNNAIKLHGIEKAKEESLKSAQATYALAPLDSGKGNLKNYWAQVIDFLNAK
jgi:hypothetical protein